MSGTAPGSRRRDAPAEATVVMKAFRSWAAAAEWAFERPVGPGKVDGSNPATGSFTPVHH